MLRQVKSAVKQRLTQEDWDRVKLRFRKFLRSIGYDPTHWIRVVQVQDWTSYLGKLSVERLDVLEISPGFESDWQKMGFRSYKAVHFPEFDVTRDVLPQKFDVIIADQVFEHVRDPYTAARNVRKMLTDDGVFMLATPFLIRVHKSPADFTRWTEDGLQELLDVTGFNAEVHAWGNKKAIIANLKRWRMYGWFGDLRNDPDLPVNVWAYAKKKPVS